MNIEKHIQWFTAYADRQISRAEINRSPMELKLTHSWKVLERCQEIVTKENFDRQIGRAALLGALYHDIGRFRQYLDYGTFKDRESCNHGMLSLKIVKQEKILADESRQTRLLAQTAIALHNRASLPKNLDKSQKLACWAVRDADKMDILRIIDGHLSRKGPYNPTVILSLPDSDTIFSPKIVQAVLERKIPFYEDLRSVNDFRLLLGAWYFDMHFISSKERLLSEGHGKRLVEGIPQQGPWERARDFLLREIFNHKTAN